MANRMNSYSRSAILGFFKNILANRSRTHHYERLGHRASPFQLATSDEHPRQFLSMPEEAQQMGTEYYDGKTKRCVDFTISITDILQMTVLVTHDYIE
ncbi:unnamed protein product [Prunus armeniaca]